MSAVRALALIDAKLTTIERRGIATAKDLREIRSALTADPEWSAVTESNLRAELADAELQASAAGALFEAALRHVEGERDRARDLAVRLEQEVAALTVGGGRRAL